MTFIITAFIVAFLLFFMEIFAPGGILFIAGGIILLFASVLVLMEHGVMPAIITLICSGVASIIMFFVEVKIMQHTGARKWFWLENQQKAKVAYYKDEDDLVGKTGQTLGTLAPTGPIQVGTQRYEAYSQSGLLKPGTSVVITAKDNFRLLVRKQDENLENSS